MVSLIQTSMKNSQIVISILICYHANIVLSIHNFQLNDENYLQVLATAMGTKSAPCYASLFTAKLEMDVHF